RSYPPPVQTSTAFRSPANRLEMFRNRHAAGILCPPCRLIHDSIRRRLALPNPSSSLEFETFVAEPRALASNAVLIKGRDEAVLVDNCLIQSDAENLVAMIRASRKALSTILITHAHPDHYFGLPALRDAFPTAKIFARPAVIDAMREYR